VEAARWYRYSAERGYAAAQNRLGGCYVRGLGVQRNFVVAAEWFRRGAVQGYALAQDNLGACYSSGRGVLLNHAEALKWYRLAATQGNASAQNHLGLCYLKGLGVRQSSSEAAAWFAKAAAQGNASAKINLQLSQTRNAGLPATQTAPITTPTVPNQPAASPAIEPVESPAGDPLTVDEIKIAASAGVKPQPLIEQIQSSNSKFSAQDVAAAQQAGIDPSVIACMRANEK
jgi:TPR repeat protein